MRPRTRSGKFWLFVSGLVLALLLAGVFTLGSLRLPIEPHQWNELVLLYALSTFIVAALLVFGLILTRSLLRLWAERRAQQLGARFKTKMVLGAMAISLLPVIFLFFVSYALLNRTLVLWFPRPLELATEESQKLLNELGRNEYPHLVALAEKARPGATDSAAKFLAHAVAAGADAAWILDAKGQVLRGGVSCGEKSLAPSFANCAEEAPGAFVRELPSGIELWRASGQYFLAARVPAGLAGSSSDAVVVGRRTTPEFLALYGDIEAQLRIYDLQKQQLRIYKTQMLLTLLLFTVLVMFAFTWFALFLSKQVTIPIQALAEATGEVSAGNFGHRVQVQAQDELGTLVRSFNDMTQQLGDSRKQIQEFTASLQQAVQELERRRNLMEAVLENIPTGVLSLDSEGNIVRLNRAAVKIFGDYARETRMLPALLGEEAARIAQHLMRRSLRMGTASKDLEITLPSRVLHAAVTVSSLGPRRANPGFVVVVDDLTELLRAQKASAWQEVAQRIAHEIKNPLTPIQLSAQRLLRFLDRQQVAQPATGDATNSVAPPDELSRLAAECAGLIQREVATLESLVDEFSQFARFPTARLARVELNAIVAGALDVFGGRLDGITLRTSLAQRLPPIKADAELLRRVLVNLIDNAAEAMEGSTVRELTVSTRLDADSETVEIVVADSGHGISPEDKDRLFLPHFTTKGRGTGLGLAISGRIVAEHHGTIRVEDNSPVGARFIIRLPAAEVPASPLPSEP